MTSENPHQSPKGVGEEEGRLRRPLRRVTTQQLSYTYTAALHQKTDGGSDRETWKKVINETLLRFQTSQTRLQAPAHRRRLMPQAQLAPFL